MRDLVPSRSGPVRNPGPPTIMPPTYWIRADDWEVYKVASQCHSSRLWAYIPIVQDCPTIAVYAYITYERHGERKLGESWQRWKCKLLCEAQSGKHPERRVTKRERREHRARKKHRHHLVKDRNITELIEGTSARSTTTVYTRHHIVHVRLSRFGQK